MELTGQLWDSWPGRGGAGFSPGYHHLLPWKPAGALRPPVLQRPPRCMQAQECMFFPQGEPRPQAALILVSRPAGHQGSHPYCHML